MKIEILGSGCEVGRSAILINDKTKILLDCGVKLQPEPPEYPFIEKCDGIIITHAHLDHCGAAPIYYKRWDPPIYMNDVTQELSRLLILDSMKVAKKQGFGVPFSMKEVRTMEKYTKLVNYYKKFKIGGFDCCLYDSGHIPGSSGILLEKNGKRIYYTGDIQTVDSHLLHKCHTPTNIDVLIIESTYSYKNHPDKKKEEKLFLESIDEIIAKEETVLIPVFAIGRAQEILLILEKYADRIALDGMAKSASDIISNHENYIKEPKKFQKILKRVNWIENQKERENAIRNYPIIVSSAGMLGGGPAIHYLRQIQKRPESKVVFCGFLVEDSPGRNLIQTKVFQNAEEKFHVHAELEQFDLSAHTDRNGLLNIIERTKPKNVICVHGERCEEFAKEIEEKYEIQAYAPKNGQIVEIKD